MFINLLKGNGQKLPEISKKELDNLAESKINGRNVSLDHSFGMRPVQNWGLDQEYCCYRANFGGYKRR